jgi:tRNA(fMet)-specific endonuclease VapC
VIRVFDTDHISILQQQSQPAYDLLKERIRTSSSGIFATSIISYHEQLQGWLAVVNQARTPNRILFAYSELDYMLHYFRSMTVLPFVQASQDHFAILRKACPRLGTIDLRIGSIAVANDATLLSRNLRDFKQMPGVRVEDWTVR